MFLVPSARAPLMAVPSPHLVLTTHPNAYAQTEAGQVQAGSGTSPISSLGSPSRLPKCPFRVSAGAELSPPVTLEEGPVTPKPRPPSVPAGPATRLCPAALRGVLAFSHVFARQLLPPGTSGLL